MANLTATSSFDSVLQLETTHQAIGGAGGTMNLQAQALLNRTQYLLDQVNTKTTLTEVKTNLNVTGSAPMYVARAWVNFNGVGTVAIRDAGNVSSVTDLGVGLYRANLTTALPNSNLCPVATQADTITSTISRGVEAYISSSSTVELACYGGGGGEVLSDTTYVSLVVLG